MKGLSAEYHGSSFVAGKPEEYRGYSALLRYMWGYDVKSADGPVAQALPAGKRPKM